MEHSIATFRSFDSQIQVLGASSSLSLPSEPPDVGNWFSSYEYESPALGSIDNFGETASKERESVKHEENDGEKEPQFEKIRNRASENDYVYHENQCLTKVPGSFCSPSLHSEPPVIRNWFPSYVYESSALELCDTIEDFVSKGSECVGEEFLFQEINGDENVNSKGSVQCDSSEEKVKAMEPLRKGGDDVEGNKNVSAHNALHLENILAPCLNTLNNDISATEYEEELGLNLGSPACKSSREASFMSLPVSRSLKNNDNMSQKLVHGEDFIEERAEAKFQNENVALSEHDINSVLVNRSSSGKSASLINNENEGNELSVNGFITMRKNICKVAGDENSRKRTKPKKKLLKCSTNMETVQLASENDVVMKRKPLTERTNLQQSNALQITGRWRCPQKGKPNLGPPLKQLRLEQWVHRV